MRDLDWSQSSVPPISFLIPDGRFVPSGRPLGS